MYHEINRCRICGNNNLIDVLDLGKQALSGHFPKPNEPVGMGPLVLVKCDETSVNSCGLLQLKHTYNLTEMYGQNYGYRSSLNNSMVKHLKKCVERLEVIAQPQSGDVVLDIGSNDGTLLSQYQNHDLELIGTDPTIAKFKSYYPEHIMQIPEFFPSAKLKQVLGKKKIKILTSIAMFYDLENPFEFVSQIADYLADDGIWFFEQSYMPTMIERNAYDTVCHEHLEYYGMKQIYWLLSKAGLKIIDAELNDVNGGSMAVMATKKDSKYPESPRVAEFLEYERKNGYGTLEPYRNFQKWIENHRTALRAKIQALQKSGRRVVGYGASTKGNVMLQYCDLSITELPFIYEVNEDKFGSETPGSQIPIVREALPDGKNNDVLLVLPWHFRDFFVDKLENHLAAGASLLFPLPEIEIVGPQT